MQSAKKMNLPNKITVFRMVCTIAIIVIALIPWESETLYTMEQTLYGEGVFAFTVKRLIIFSLFTIGSLSDFVDGYLARKYHLVTTFGKFMDPIADKILVNSMFLLLTATGEIPVLVTIIMIGRDTIVDAIKLVMSDAGVVIAASKWGKAKTVSQMLALIVVLLYLFPMGFPLGLVLSYIAAVISLISGIDYFWKNRKTLLEGMLG